LTIFSNNFVVFLRGMKTTSPNRTQEIKSYYNELASSYDENRFGHSYGQYLHKQETGILKQWSRNWNSKDTIDLACGTGRFLEFAKNGVDISEHMILEARMKYPSHNLICSDLVRLPLASGRFNQAISFHLFMHLTEEKTKEIFEEVYRILAPNGVFVWDIPSKKRRGVFRRPKEDWHGAQAYDHVDIQRLAGDKWKVKSSRGIAFFPVHRLPQGLRPIVRGLDSFLCRMTFKHYASYLIIKMEKK
jgi:ubiquinone/menaquinone biosynthesis C-methylase UbiE